MASLSIEHHRESQLFLKRMHLQASALTESPSGYASKLGGHERQPAPTHTPYSRDIHVFVDIGDVLLQVGPNSRELRAIYTNHAQLAELHDH